LFVDWRKHCSCYGLLIFQVIIILGVIKHVGLNANIFFKADRFCFVQRSATIPVDNFCLTFRMNNVEWTMLSCKTGID
jgi:hypothetical protein